MTRRKERQARRNLALAARRTVEAEERVTRVGFASVSRVEAARREVELCATSEALDMTEDQQRDWAYDFAANERLHVYLTNTLEEAAKRVDENQVLVHTGKYIADEANAASEVKRDLPVMVVLGNPPYSNFGMMNRGAWIRGLLEDYKTGLGERKINLDDDFIKFLRFGQWRIQETGQGVLAYITSNTYLDGITHRRMRQSLMETFSDIYILNLHGSTKKREVSPDGTRDENVFDIQQGVAIGIFVKVPGRAAPATVRYADLWGVRQRKYDILADHAVDSTRWTQLNPIQPYFFFTPKNFAGKEEYEGYLGVSEILPEHNAGIQTKRDALVYHFTQAELQRVVRDMISLPVEEIRSRYNLPPDGRDWTVSDAKTDVMHGKGKQTLVAYHPFDWRWTLYSAKTGGFMAYPRFPLMANALSPNRLLLTVRNPRRGNVDSFFVANTLVDKDAVSPFDNATFFPLYLYPSAPEGEMWGVHGPEANQSPDTPGHRRANLAPTFISDLTTRLNMRWLADGRGDRITTLGPEDAFAWLYAILHAPSYRERYAEFLKVDFPRVPLTSNAELFRALAGYGDKLIALHLMETTAEGVASFPVKGSDRVEQVRYTAPGEGAPEGRVWISAAQYFGEVEPEVWDFHIGGYQVAEKWLKDRKGRTLSYDEQKSYSQIVAALRETMRLMEATDAEIEGHGSWPLG